MKKIIFLLIFIFFTLNLVNAFDSGWVEVVHPNAGICIDGCGAGCSAFFRTCSCNQSEWHNKLNIQWIQKANTCTGAGYKILCETGDCALTNGAGVGKNITLPASGDYYISIEARWGIEPNETMFVGINDWGVNTNRRQVNDFSTDTSCVFKNKFNFDSNNGQIWFEGSFNSNSVHIKKFRVTSEVPCGVTKYCDDGTDVILPSSSGLNCNECEWGSIFVGDHNARGLTNFTNNGGADPRFICYNNEFKSCNWEIVYPNGINLVDQEDRHVTDYFFPVISNEGWLCKSDNTWEYISRDICYDGTDDTIIDHEGNDWIITSDDEIVGYHINVGDFNINSSANVTIKPVDGTSCGSLRVEAENVNIKGTLDATGAGLPGGGGGGGGGGGAQESKADAGAGGDGCYKGSNGEKGNTDGAGEDWRSGYGGTGGDGCGPNKGTGGSGGGEVENSDGANGSNGNDGYYGDFNQTNYNLNLGSGGGGGGGASGGSNNGNENAGGGGGAGAAGGSGGGTIEIYSNNKIILDGKILSKGSLGENGGNGNDPSSCSNNEKAGTGGSGGSGYVIGSGAGGSGGDPCSGSTGDGGTGGKGGSGAGGGILLYSKNKIEINGEINVMGGRDQLTNSGAIKLFSCNSIINGDYLKVNDSRLAQNILDSCTQPETCNPEIENCDETTIESCPNCSILRNLINIDVEDSQMNDENIIVNFDVLCNASSFVENDINVYFEKVLKNNELVSAISNKEFIECDQTNNNLEITINSVEQGNYLFEFSYSYEDNNCPLVECSRKNINFSTNEIDSGNGGSEEVTIPDNNLFVLILLISFIVLIIKREK